MRAIFNKNIEDEIAGDNTLLISGQQLHHLGTVARVRAGEDIIVINGRGILYKGKVECISEKKIKLYDLCRIECPRNDQFHLAICLPKKETMEEILRSSVEMGICKIIPIISDYSQMRVFQRSSRFEKIMESALIQSNNPYFPEITSSIKLDELLLNTDQYFKIYIFTSKMQNNLGKIARPNVEKKLFLIGPEGGFSQREEQIFDQCDIAEKIFLPVPILRSQTAVCVALGFLQGLSSGTQDCGASDC